MGKMHLIFFSLSSSDRCFQDLPKIQEKLRVPEQDAFTCLLVHVTLLEFKELKTVSWPIQTRVGRVGIPGCFGDNPFCGSRWQK